MASIPSLLFKARQAKGFTQAKLGKILGVAQGYVSQVENGKHDIKVSTLMDWARVLDLEVMLIPRQQVASVKFFLRASETGSEEHPPPAYGALPDEIA